MSDAKTGHIRGAGRGAAADRGGQAVLDGWEQDEDGLDPELGAGGACQEVASAMTGALCEIVANLADGVFRIDVLPGAYETEAGYAWRKRDGVRLGPENLILERVEGPIPYEAFRYRYAEKGAPEPFCASAQRLT